jgi:hypothetical protein
MEVIKKLNFFFKKLKLNEEQYNELLFKSTCYDNMISCVHINKEIETLDVRQGKTSTIICKFTNVVNYICSINIIEMLKAGGFTFDKSMKLDISTEEKLI